MTRQDGENDQVLADQVREAIGVGGKAVRSTVTANILASGLLVLIMRGQVAETMLFGWLGVQVVFQLLRVVIARRYLSTPPVTGAQQRRWARALSALSILSGGLWGSAGILFYLPDSAAHQALLAILLCGLAAGSIPANAMMLPGLLGSSTAIIGLFVARIAWEGGANNWLMAAMLSLYLAFVLNWGRGLHSVLIDSLRRRHENLALIGQLQQQTETALQALRIAEEANIAKSRFLAAASHDLRQPMHALSLLSGALLEEGRPNEMKALTRHIARSVEALEMLFNSLLDITKLDAGITQPKPLVFRLEDVFERLRNDFQQLAENKYLRLHIRPTTALGHTDAQLLEQILRNLLANAVRYTESGGIVVGCRKRGKTWRIDVVDTGIGIPASERERIYDEFYQIGNPERDRTKGLGLGLAIVRRLANLLDMPLTMRSRVGKGTVFSLTVPLGTGPIQAPTQTRLSGLDFDSLRVLIVDDEADVRLALALLLVGWGCDVLEAESLAQTRAEMAAAKWQPELAIVDLRLRQEESGIDLLDWLRAHVDPTLRGMIITGDIATERLADIKSSGYALLHKPVAPAKLRALMQQMVGKRAQTRSGQ